MSLNQAKKCFQENCNLVDPRQDPVGWNMNNGLQNLVIGLMHELSTAQRERSELARRIANLEAR